MNDKYTVINRKEPRGQSVAENGIPCTARSCVTQLNRLSQENKELRTKEIILKNKLNDLYEAIDEHYTENGKKNDNTAIIRAETELDLITKILNEYENLKITEKIYKLSRDEKMRFKTLSEYDEEIKKIDEILHSFKRHIEECPEDIGTKTNYESLKYIRNELKKERDNLEFYKATQEALDRWDDSIKNVYL